MKNRNKKNGFKLHVSKQVLMFVAGSFASKQEEIQGNLLKTQSQIYKCSKEKNMNILLDDKLHRNQCHVCYRARKNLAGSYN